MNVVTQMLEARPDERGVDHATLALAIDALQDVAAASAACADACLSEPDVALRIDCIRACADAADVAGALAKVLSRTGPTSVGTRSLVGATAKLLSELAKVTGEHGEMDKHCRITSETASRAEQALQSLEADVAAANRSAAPVS